MIHYLYDISFHSSVQGKTRVAFIPRAQYHDAQMHIGLLKEPGHIDSISS